MEVRCASVSRGNAFNCDSAELPAKADAVRERAGGSAGRDGFASDCVMSLIVGLADEMPPVAENACLKESDMMGSFWLQIYC